MNGFLLVARGPHDDMPLGFHATLELATAAAHTWTERAVYELAGSIEASGGNKGPMFSMGEVLCYVALTYTDGLPVAGVKVRDCETDHDRDNG